MELLILTKNRPAANGYRVELEGRIVGNGATKAEAKADAIDCPEWARAEC